MLQRVYFLIRFYIFWLAIFITQKIIFLLFNHRESFVLSIKTWLLILWHGLRLDLSAGRHVLRFQAVGHNPESKGYLMGIDHVIVK